MERWRQRGDVSPGSSRRRIRSPLHAHRSWLLKLVAVQPDLTLNEVQQRLADRGVAIRIASIWRFFDREGVSSKKNAVALRAGQARRRAQKASWKRYQGKVDPARLVFIDETSAQTNMVRTHGWGRRGQRLRGQAPHGHWQTFTFLAALQHDRIDAPCVLDGPINSESFKAYIEQFLVPTLKPGDIVIMDDLAAATRVTPCAGPSVLSERGFSSCRPIAPISIPSSRCSPS